MIIERIFKIKKDLNGSKIFFIPKGTIMSEDRWLVVIGRKKGTIDLNSSDKEWFELVDKFYYGT